MTRKHALYSDSELINISQDRIIVGRYELRLVMTHESVSRRRPPLVRVCGQGRVPYNGTLGFSCEPRRRCARRPRVLPLFRPWEKYVACGFRSPEV